MKKNTPEISNKEKFVTYFDVLNIIACLAVLILHHNGIVWQFSKSWSWRISLLVECAFYWAVPIFLMLSGETLMNYRQKYSTRTFFKKRFIRTVIPWLCWSIIILIWKVSTGQITLESYNMLYIMNLILGNKVENVYWFFMTLFGIYLCMPVLANLVKNRKVLWYIVGTAFIMYSCFPVINQIIGINMSITIPVASGLIIFPVLGYLLATMELRRKTRFWLYASAIMATMFRYIYTYIWSYRTETTDVSIKGYEKFYSVLLAAAVFVLIKSIRWDNILKQKSKEFLHTLASYSFGVYLIHMIVIYYELRLLNQTASMWSWRTIFVPMTYGIALCIVWALNKIPVIKKIIGR